MIITQAQGAAVNAFGQGLSMLAGVQRQFDWTGVATAGVTASVGGALKTIAGTRGANIDTGSNFGRFGTAGVNAGINLAVGVVNSKLRSVIDGGDFGRNLQAEIPNIIASALGDALHYGGGSGGGGVLDGVFDRVGAWTADRVLGQANANPVDEQTEKQAAKVEQSPDSGRSENGGNSFVDPVINQEAVARLRADSQIVIGEGLGPAPLEPEKAPLTAGRSTAATLTELQHGDWLNAEALSRAGEETLRLPTIVVSAPKRMGFWDSVEAYQLTIAPLSSIDRNNDGIADRSVRHIPAHLEVANARMRADRFGQQVATAAGVGLTAPFAALGALEAAPVLVATGRFGFGYLRSVPGRAFTIGESAGSLVPGMEAYGATYGGASLGILGALERTGAFRALDDLARSIPRFDFVPDHSLNGAMGGGLRIVPRSKYEFFQPNAIEHVLDGQVVARADGSLRATGGHYLRSGDVQLDTVTGAADINGVIEGLIKVRDPSTGKWLSKQAKTTFFPESWSRRQTIDEIAHAYQNRIEAPYQPGFWQGTTVSGVPVSGWRDHNGIRTAYPEYLGN